MPLNYSGHRMYYLHGTLGSGKSHILAALACLLMKEVIELCICQIVGLCFVICLGTSSLRYLVLAYNQDSDTTARQYLERCKAIDQLSMSCIQAPTDHKLLFIIDQTNALDPIDEAFDRLTLEAKREARTLLDRITAIT